MLKDEQKWCCHNWLFSLDSRLALDVEKAAVALNEVVVAASCYLLAGGQHHAANVLSYEAHLY